MSDRSRDACMKALNRLSCTSLGDSCVSLCVSDRSLDGRLKGAQVRVSIDSLPPADACLVRWLRVNPLVA